MAAELKSHCVGHTMVLSLSDAMGKNTLGPDIYAAGIEALNAADSSAEVRSVVLTGEGKLFSAGGDLKRLRANRLLDPAVQAHSIDQLHNWIATIHSFPKPVIAAVEGAAAGAGFSLALACDFVVAARSAVFVMSYSHVALSPDGGGSWALGRTLPRALAMECLMRGSRISAERLHQLGLVNQLSEDAQALHDALTLADSLNQRAPNVLASIKELVNDAPWQPLHQHLQSERRHFVRNLFHANAAEGIDAFLSKRTPNYE